MRRTAESSSPELQETARTVASLALDRLDQEGTLKVRQREYLRRAYAAAADALDWRSIPGTDAERVAAIASEVVELASEGARSLEEDLALLLKEKRAEMPRLRAVAKEVQALGDREETEYPMELEYVHTARNGSQGYVTKRGTLVIQDAESARSAAATLEKRLDGYAKLRDEMLADLKERQRRVEEMRSGLNHFVASSDELLSEVLESLH